MISLILLFPLAACFILFLLKKEALNSIMVNLYALIHLICSVCLCADINPVDIKQNFFGIDDLSRIFLLVLSIVFAAVSAYSSGYMKDDKSGTRRLRHYSYAVLLFVFSMTGVILSLNLGVMWVFIEAAALASTYLIYFHKTKHSIEAAWKYIFIGSIGIALAFAGIIMLVISSGSLNSLYFNDLYQNAEILNKFWLKLSFVFILIGIGTKMGLSPMHFWLPDAHAESVPPVSAMLSASLLNCAFFMLIKVFKIMILAHHSDYGRILLLAMGFLSLFIAAVFIYHINNYKRMLAYSSIENMGILALGAALGSAGMIAALIHLIGHSFIKASFFMTSGNILKIYGSKKIEDVKGILNADRKTGILWTVSFLGIAAFPPSMLFISEFLMLKTMFEKGYYFMGAAFMFLLLIILYGLAKAVFHMAAGENRPAEIKLPYSMYIPQVILLGAAFILGIFMPYMDALKSAVIGF